jgi:8-oxo-dGTP diphosphatase
MPTTHLLARAVVQQAGHVLLVQADGQAHTFLPGGHVEANEGLTDCLHRELQEELGVEARVEAYRGVVEHRWRHNGKRQYELNHCFATALPSLSADRSPPAQEDYLQFGWVPAEHEALAEVDLQPAPLRRLLADDGSHTPPWWASTLSPPASDSNS